MPYRFAIDDLARMVDAGILHEDDRVELLSGQVVTTAPIGEALAAAVDQVAAVLFEVARGCATVRVQGPLAIATDTQVQPDVAVIARGRVAPGTVRAAAAIHLVVEVADSSLAYDRSVKLAVYARAGIAEAWLLNLLGTPPGALVARRRGEATRDGGTGYAHGIEAGATTGCCVAIPVCNRRPRADGRRGHSARG